MQDLAAREKELNERQKLLEEMSKDIKELANDVVEMKRDYASNVMESDEMKDTLERLEIEKQQKIEEAKLKLENKMNDKREELMNKPGVAEKYDEKMAKLDELMKKQAEWDKKLENFQHTNL